MIEKIRNSKKGFTLVEVIVVLVILAILAAILIPSLTGYIDKAKEKVVLTEARSLFLAAQTELSEEYAKGSFAEGSMTITDGAGTGTNATLGNAIVKLSEIPTASATWDATITYNSLAKITAVTYISDGHTATYHDVAGGTGTSAYTAGWTIE